MCGICISNSIRISINIITIIITIIIIRSSVMMIDIISHACQPRGARAAEAPRMQIQAGR